MRKVISLATYAYTLLVIAASLMKLVITFMPQGVSNGDKYGHAIAYFGFTIIWSLYFYVRNKEYSKKIFFNGVFRAAIFGVLFGMLMEVAQLVLTSYRQFDFKDALANSTGVLLAIPLLYFFSNFFMLIKK